MKLNVASVNSDKMIDRSVYTLQWQGVCNYATEQLSDVIVHTLRE